MTDPFESLRHNADDPGSTSIDPQFHAELLAEARRQLAGTFTVVVRQSSPAEAPTAMPMKTATRDENRSRVHRTYLLAAASVAIVIGGVLAIAAIAGDDETTPAASAPPQGTPEAAPTTFTTTPVTRLDESAIAEAVLLSGEEYAPDWVAVPNGPLVVSTNSEIARGIPECAPFVDSVFGVAERGASALRTFWHNHQPEAFATQYVIVLPDAATARSVYELVNSVQFAACVSAYGTVLDGGQAPSSFPSPVDQPITDPPFESIGDALTYRTFPETWYENDGTPVGPQTDVDAVMLVGRTITFIGTVTENGRAAVLNTTDQFRAALQHVVERTNAALAGTPST